MSHHVINPIAPFIILLIAHLIGDFVLQTEQMALKKSRVLSWLVLHALQLGVITWVLCWKFGVWPIALVIFLTHLIFDWIKPRLPGDPLRWYLIDQAVHLGVLWLVALWIVKYMEGDSMPLTSWMPFNVQVIIAAYLAIGRPITIGLGLFLKSWQDELLKLNQSNFESSVNGLTRSGEWIGNLERFFVLTCVLVNQFLLVGAILIAKAVMRQGDATKIEQRKMADYVILGTLGSFGLAFLVGILARLVFIY